jgi:hypothetical protein
MKTLLTLLLTLVCLTSAFARIGETEQQIETRYGKPVADLTESGGTVSHRYRTAEWEIVVDYFNGKSGVEIFSRKDHGKFSQAGLARLLTQSAEGGEWIAGAKLDASAPRDVRQLVPGDGTIEWTQKNGRRAQFNLKYQDVMFDTVESVSSR